MIIALKVECYYSIKVMYTKIMGENLYCRGVMDESGEQFVAYFLPLEETLEKRRRDFTAGIEYADDEEYEYKMAREYNWNVKSKASKGYEENYFLVIRQEGVRVRTSLHSRWQLQSSPFPSLRRFTTTSLKRACV